MPALRQSANGFKEQLRGVVRRHAFLRPIANFFLAQICCVRTLWSRLTRRFVIDRYLKDHSPRGLHLGCGSNIHRGCLNTDLQVSCAGAVFLDATKPFPLPDNSIDHVFSEHMIEHVSHAEGLYLLRECFRILKPSGRVRIATPNLEVLLKLHSAGEGSDAAEYLRWFAIRHLSGFQTGGPAVVINYFFYHWGHCFIYDRATLEESFRDAGFTNLQWCAVRESVCPQLRNLERHGVILGSERWNAFETMVLEGLKAGEF